MESVYGNLREAALDLAYLAGIIDGEGCITIKYNKRTDVHFVALSVGMTELPAVELMVRVFGGKLRKELPGGKNSVRNKAMYRWETSNSGLVNTVLTALLPYLRVKKAQAILALSFIEGVRAAGGGPRTSESEKLRRKELYQKVKELNASAPATTNRANTREGEVIV